MKSLSTRTLALSGALAALSATVQLIHVGYQSPVWGMWIDVVAVTWVIAYFLFGMRSSFVVSLAGALIITFFAPDTWLGASMKWAATMPVITALFAWDALRTTDGKRYTNPSRLIIPMIAGVAARCAIVVPLNYFYAIPIWTGMTPEVAMKTIPWFIIAAFNAVQSVLDVVLAWIVVYKFKLNRFSTLQGERLLSEG